MHIGLIGLEKSGKTTIFNALTGSTIDTAAFSQAKKEPNIAVVEVSDPRVARLSEMYQPKKITYATIECMDFVGLPSSEEKKQIFPPSELALIKNADALALVLRNFRDDLIEQTYGAPDSLADMNTLITELIISDLIIAENRMERVEHYIKRGASTPEMGLEKKALERIIEGLNENRLIRDLELSVEEIKHLRGFQFLTLKPLMVILNSDEDSFGCNEELIAGIEKNCKAIEFAGRFEMELGRLSEEEAREFMEDMHIQASARDRLSMLAYAVLGYITFFTVGPDEVRAWTIKDGDTAVAAAGAIHSDLARGFIRAECFHYDSLMELGSEKAIK
nr:DUF933 domain-containing protein [Deltaproteobacteria bacterium]